jgi:hypothetical protein
MNCGDKEQESDCSFHLDLFSLSPEGMPCTSRAKPFRSPPCSIRKATALPNSPPTENPSSSRAAVMMIGAAMPIVA